MNYYIIAGEASGDLHASNLMKQLRLRDVNAGFRCWGGDLMKAQGAELVKHYRDLAFMGFTEVVMNLPTILNNIRFCKKDILRFRPDAVILVDYPGFNLRIAEFAKKQGIKVFYYISPQVWAWKQSRVHKIKRVVDKMLVILPFEKEFYKQFNYNVEFVGHPLLDAIEEEKAVKPTFEQFTQQNALPAKPIIALLPGSRKQEIKTMLPLMLATKSKFANYQFVIAGAPSQQAAFYEQFISNQDVKVVYNQTYALLQQATAALVTSGTATLETALFNVPEVVCYKGGKISYTIAKQLIKVKYISLVNLIMDKLVVKELIQQECNVNNLTAELNTILTNPAYRKQITENYQLLKQQLGGAGASAKAAEIINKCMFQR